MKLSLTDRQRQLLLARDTICEYDDGSIITIHRMRSGICIPQAYDNMIYLISEYENVTHLSARVDTCALCKVTSDMKGWALQYVTISICANCIACVTDLAGGYIAKSTSGMGSLVKHYDMEESLSASYEEYPRFTVVGAIKYQNNMYSRSSRFVLYIEQPALVWFDHDCNTYEFGATKKRARINIIQCVWSYHQALRDHVIVELVRVITNMALHYNPHITGQ